MTGPPLRPSGSAPSSPSAPSARRGLVLSIEVLLATLLLFGFLVIISNLVALQEQRPSGLPLLRYYAQDTVRAGLAQGAWRAILSDANDSAARALVDALPPGVCVRVSLYNETPAPARLAYSYTPLRCRIGVDTPRYLHRELLVVPPPRDASNPLSAHNPQPAHYYVESLAYPAGGA